MWRVAAGLVFAFALGLGWGDPALMVLQVVISFPIWARLWIVGAYDVDECVKIRNVFWTWTVRWTDVRAVRVRRVYYTLGHGGQICFKLPTGWRGVSGSITYGPWRVEKVATDFENTARSREVADVYIDREKLLHSPFP